MAAKTISGTLFYIFGGATLATLLIAMFSYEACKKG